MEIGRLDFVWPQLSLSRQSRGFAVVCDPPQINWTRERGLSFFLFYKETVVNWLF